MFRPVTPTLEQFPAAEAAAEAAAATLEGELAEAEEAMKALAKSGDSAFYSRTNQSQNVVASVCRL